MSFLKNNWEVLILVILAIASEYIILFFVDVPFNDVVNLNAVLYYLVAQFGLLTFVPSIIIFWLLPRTKIASLLIAFGLILWNIKEMGDEISYIIGTNSNVFKTSLGQLAMLCMIVFWAWFGYTKWKS